MGMDRRRERISKAAPFCLFCMVWKKKKKTFIVFENEKLSVQRGRQLWLLICGHGHEGNYIKMLVQFASSLGS